jgi:lipopolysaccharide transport system permease protein
MANLKTTIFFQVLMFKTLANLKSEVSRYYLNFLWWIMEPVLMLGLFYVVFGVFLNRKTENYVAFLLCGLTAWNWFNRTVSNSAGSICSNHGLMMQLDINKAFFPIEVFLQDAFKHIFVVALLLIFLMVYPTPVGLTWLAFPVLLFVQAFLILGVSMLVSALVPFFPDLKFIVQTGLTIMFFASGIFFSIGDVVLPEHRYLMFLNPMAGLIELYRDVLIYEKWPDWLYLFKVLVFSFTLSGLGLMMIWRFDKQYPRICQ